MNDKPLTPRAVNVLKCAHAEADRLGHNYVGTEHLLLGLLREGEGIGAGLLETHGVTLAKMRTAIQFITGTGTK